MSAKTHTRNQKHMRRSVTRNNVDEIWGQQPIKWKYCESTEYISSKIDCSNVNKLYSKWLIESARPWFHGKWIQIVYRTPENTRHNWKRKVKYGAPCQTDRCLFIFKLNYMWWSLLSCRRATVNRIARRPSGKMVRPSSQCVWKNHSRKTQSAASDEMERTETK